jgi:hypothetical protein
MCDKCGRHYLVGGNVAVCVQVRPLMSIDLSGLGDSRFHQSNCWKGRFSKDLAAGRAVQDTKFKNSKHKAKQIGGSIKAALECTELAQDAPAPHLNAI